MYKLKGVNMINNKYNINIIGMVLISYIGYIICDIKFWLFIDKIVFFNDFLKNVCILIFIIIIFYINMYILNKNKDV